MPNYRRDYTGTCWFFTVVTYQRKPIFANDLALERLRQSIHQCRVRYPFQIDAWVVLPDHMHCIWSLPEGDRDYSRRWSVIKRRFTQSYADHTGEFKPPFWQPRFWAHALFDERDYNHHFDYVHYNPVKHGYVEEPGLWPASSFSRHVRAGYYPNDWGADADIPDTVGRE